MANIIDPYVYKDRYANIPKLVVDTCGDEFFMVRREGHVQQLTKRTARRQLVLVG